MRPRLAVLAAALLLFGFGEPTSAAGPRIVSINLCADQLLLSFADPDQIVGLSPFARNPTRSWAAADAARFPVLSGTAEEILALKPDLVLAGLFTKRDTRDLLRRHGYRVVDLAIVSSLAEARTQMAEVATLLGHPERAQGAVAALDAAVGRARAGRRADLRVLPLERRGWVFGENTLVSDLLAAVGLRNAGRDFGPGSAHQTSLEAIVAARPDRLLLSASSEVAEDQGTALLNHPALAGLYPAARRIVLPERLTVCGGPMLAEAIDRLAAAADH